MTLGNDNGTDGQTDRQTDRRTDRVRRNMRPPPREEGRIIIRAFVRRTMSASELNLRGRYIVSLLTYLLTYFRYLYTPNVYCSMFILNV